MTLVSVCIPAYRSAWSLGAALRSALAQDGVDLEVVVSDNASTDGTAELLAAETDPRLRVVAQAATVPMAQNWRAAVAASRGEHVKLLCADDLLLPGALRAQSRILERHPAITVAAARRQIVGEDGEVLKRARGLEPWRGRVDGSEVVRRYARNGSNVVGEPVAVMFRRSDYDAVGGFDAGARYVLDIDLWLRLLRRGDLWADRTPRGAFRISDRAVTAQESREHLRENQRLVDRLAADPRWEIGPLARAYGRVNVPRIFYQWRAQSRLLTRGAGG